MKELTIQQFPELIKHVGAEMKLKSVSLAELDAKTGDGDLGVTVVLIFRAMDKYLGKHGISATFSELFLELSEVVNESAPSTFGTLFSTMLQSVGNGIGDVTVIDGTVFAKALNLAAEGVMKRGKASLGDKTLLDALIPAGIAATDASGKDFGCVATVAATAAQKGAADTENMRATKGRAEYMGERTVGNRDPGAEAIAEILSSISAYCSLST